MVHIDPMVGSGDPHDWIWWYTSSGDMHGPEMVDISEHGDAQDGSTFSWSRCTMLLVTGWSYGVHHPYAGSPSTPRSLHNHCGGLDYWMY